MTDLEITRRCAEAMGLDKFEWQTPGIVTGSNLPILMPSGRISYDPLHDKAQAFELVERFPLLTIPAMWAEIGHPASEMLGYNLPRAICLCVAGMKQPRKERE